MTMWRNRGMGSLRAPVRAQGWAPAVLMIVGLLALTALLVALAPPA
jgi:hypothetical protein